MVNFNGDRTGIFVTAAMPTAMRVSLLGVVIMTVERVSVSEILGMAAVVLEIEAPDTAARVTYHVTAQSDRTNVDAPSFRVSSAPPASALVMRPRAVTCSQLLSS